MMDSFSNFQTDSLAQAKQEMKTMKALQIDNPMEARSNSFIVDRMFPLRWTTPFE